MLWLFIFNFLLFSSLTAGGATKESSSFAAQGFSKNYYALGVEVDASSAVVAEAKNGQILFTKQPDHRQPLASITKLMSALVLLDEPLDWQKQVVVPPDNQTKSHFLRAGDKITLRDLFYIGLIGSDNRAISILAQESGLSFEEFVDKMNKKAQELGMRDTVFSDPTGLDPGNISTAADVVLLARKAFSQPLIRGALSRSFFRVTTPRRYFTVYNTNRLLGYVLDNKYTFLLGKTGYLEEAGYCFVGLAQDKEEREVISVVLGSPSREGRFLDTKRIVWWVLENWRW